MSEQAAPGVPYLDAAADWLASVDDPLATLVAATAGVELPEVDLARIDPAMAIERALAVPAIDAGLSGQRADGSWGDDDRPARRVLPTLRTVQTLADLGLASTGAWQRAADFLAATAHVDGGPISIDGQRHNVLSCYVGIAATAYLLGDRGDLAEPQLAWIAEHQDVRVDGTCRLSSDPVHWDDRLATRFGGCMASTTCLLGLVKTGRALALDAGSHRATEYSMRGHRARDRGMTDHRVVEPDVRDQGAGARDARAPGDRARRGEVLAAIREALLERRLMYRRSDAPAATDHDAEADHDADAGIVPLGSTAAHAGDWLEPTFPLDWRTDLVEVLDVVRRAGPPDARMQPAIDHLARMQLPDGSWPLRRTLRPDHLPALERRSRTRGSPIATARVLAALTSTSDSQPFTHSA